MVSTIGELKGKQEKKVNNKQVIFSSLMLSTIGELKGNQEIKR